MTTRSHHIGKVYLARERETGVVVAIKVLMFQNYISNGIQDQIKNEMEVDPGQFSNELDSMQPRPSSNYKTLWSV